MKKYRPGDRVVIRDDLRVEDFDWCGLPLDLAGHECVVIEQREADLHVDQFPMHISPYDWFVPFEFVNEVKRRCMFDSIS